MRAAAHLLSPPAAIATAIPTALRRLFCVGSTCDWIVTWTVTCDLVICASATAALPPDWTSFAIHGDPNAHGGSGAPDPSAAGGGAHVTWPPV
eukprot:4666202-Prymnesium_polylepis.1